MSAAALAKAMMGAIGENDEVQEVPGWLDSGFPPLNMVMSGNYDQGLPYGRIVEIYGPSSAGKTAIATLFMAAAQAKGGVAGFNDHEKTFDLGMAKQVGLQDNFPYWIYKRPQTWEESNTIAMKGAEAIRTGKLIPEEAPVVWVFDSVAAMIPKSVFFDKDGKRRGIDELTMNDTTALARVSSTTLKSVNAMTNDFNTCMLYLNQIRTKPGVAYGDPTTTPGGSSMEFYASIRLSLTRSRTMETTAGVKEMVGQTITIKAVKNKVARPFQTCTLNMKFGDDGMVKFDFTTSLLEYMKDNKMLDYSAPYFTWEGKKYHLKTLADLIDKEGLYPKLVSMLPR